ncbi:MAG: calcium-binding protein, partial [Burkholderiales bacterium]|nr:calcium-binding protein [Burkholderiales bacterium]
TVLGAGDGTFSYYENTGTSAGGADVLYAGEGDNVVVGGVGADSVAAGAGNDTIAGDNAQITYYTSPSQVQTAQTTDSLVDQPTWGDTIVAGGGTNVVLAGLGDDHVNDPAVTFSAGAVPSAGNDFVAGDNGNFNFDSAGNPTSFESTELGFGGDDVLLVGDGNNVVIGGFGADLLLAGTGNDTIAGDNAQIDFFTGSSIVNIAQTTDTVASTGDNDIIVAGNGNNLVFGGVASDAITTGGGADIVTGDNGTAIFNPDGSPLQVLTGDPLLGGNDSISTGDGFDVAMGGAFSDVVYSAGGNDILFGDGGMVAFSAGGTQLYIISVDVLFGGNDILNGGTGNDILIGGAGSDFLYGNLSEDLLFGDNAAVTLRNGFVTNIQADFNDLITGSLFDEFNADGLGDDDEGGAGLAGDLQESELLIAGALGGDLSGGLLDADAFRRIFSTTVAVASLQAGHDLILESGQRPDSQDEGVVPQEEEDDSTGQDRGAEPSAEEPAPVLADERAQAAAALVIAPPAAVNPGQRDGELLAAALGLAGLRALQPPPAGGGRKRLDSRASRRTVRGILRRLRKAAAPVSHM